MTQGHQAAVNVCAWNARNPALLATASDDGTVRVWISDAARRATAAQRGGAAAVG